MKGRFMRTRMLAAATVADFPIMRMMFLFIMDLSWMYRFRPCRAGFASGAKAPIAAKAETKTDMGWESTLLY